METVWFYNKETDYIDTLEIEFGKEWKVPFFTFDNIEEFNRLVRFTLLQFIMKNPSDFPDIPEGHFGTIKPFVSWKDDTIHLCANPKKAYIMITNKELKFV